MLPSYTAPATRIVFKGGIGHIYVARLHNAVSIHLRVQHPADVRRDRRGSEVFVPSCLESRGNV